MYLVSINKQIGYEVINNTMVYNNIENVIKMAFKTFYNSGHLNDESLIKYNSPVKKNNGKYINVVHIDDLVHNIVYQQWLFNGGISIGEDGVTILENIDFSNFLIEIKKGKKTCYPSYENTNGTRMCVKYFEDELRMSYSIPVD